EDSVHGVAFSPDGRRLAAASFDRTVSVWDVASGRRLARLAGHRRKVADVAYSPDGRWLASVASDTTVRLWPVR
ncbi:MAG TPA: hypothetical protein VHG08_16430, partial [Longimicrobium sp.]|nr:hypothetical protein [Longimicrobium sp.]